MRRDFRLVLPSAFGHGHITMGNQAMELAAKMVANNSLDYLPLQFFTTRDAELEHNRVALKKGYPTANFDELALPWRDLPSVRYDACQTINTQMCKHI